MKIGLFTVESGWRSDGLNTPDNWTKIIYKTSDPVERFDITVYRIHGNIWYLGYNVFAKEYLSMFGGKPVYRWNSDIEATQHLDRFLNKLSKLISFT